MGATRRAPETNEAEGACELRLGPHQGLCANQALLLLAPIPSAPPPPTGRSPRTLVRLGSRGPCGRTLQDPAWAECGLKKRGKPRTARGGEGGSGPLLGCSLDLARGSESRKQEEGGDSEERNMGPAGCVFLLPLLLGVSGELLG